MEMMERTEMSETMKMTERMEMQSERLVDVKCEFYIILVTEVLQHILQLLLWLL